MRIYANKARNGGYSDYDLLQELSDSAYAYAGLGGDRIAEIMSKRLGIAPERTKRFVGDNFYDAKGGIRMRPGRKKAFAKE